MKYFLFAAQQKPTLWASHVFAVSEFCTKSGASFMPQLKTADAASHSSWGTLQ
jgi:hypothetical protein